MELRHTVGPSTRSREIGGRRLFAGVRAPILAALASLLIAATPAQQGQSMRMADGDFEDSDWQLTTLANHPAIDVDVARRAIGGEPDAFRVIRHDMPAPRQIGDDPHVVSLHRYTAASYDPARSGAIRAFCYEEDSLVLIGFGQGQGRGMALWQAGRTFAAAIAPTGVPRDWQHTGPHIFHQDDFFEVFEGATNDRSSHPDFSPDGGRIDVGFLRTNTSSSAGFILEAAIDNWAVEINCEEGVTPPGTPSPTPTVASVATPSPTATLTPFVYPTVSPTPSRIYLPLILGERCPPSDLFADIALVVDASTTMGEHSRSGQRKIDLAVAATRALLAGLRLHPGGDRISLVSFNNTATTLAPLTDDHNALEMALSRIVLHQQSRIDLGLLAGAQSLSTARPEAMRALILLSDGLANPAPASDVLEAAASVHSSGISLYVVGVGPNMDRSFLREIAADPQRFFASADPDLLGSIFDELARRVPCPPGVYWGQRTARPSQRW